MAKTGLGVTIGNHTLRAVKLQRKKDGTYVVQRVFADRLNDQTRAVAGIALRDRGFRNTPATVGLTGRDVIIRYSQVPPVPEWRLRTLMKYEVDEVGSQSGGDVSADYRRLNLPDPDGERPDDTILVALARNVYLDQLIRACGEGGVSVAGTCPNSVALFNAFAVNATYAEDETCLLVNLGSENLDIAVQRGGELLFARNATPGAGAFTDAIQQAFSTSLGKAEQMKLAKADVTPKAQARYPDATSEKVANAIVGVAGQLASLIQSTLMIARAQAKIPDLKVDRVLLAGGGASLKGLDLYLKQAMGVTVERFNPFPSEIHDLSGLTPEERALVEKAPHEFAVAVGLAQSRVDPLAFPLEVLPSALRRRREFVTKGIWAAGAAVVAVAILGVIYQGRKSAGEEATKALGKLRSQTRTVEREDERFREVLRLEQENAVKHRLLAAVTAPGALFGKTWSVLEDSLVDARDVYLQSVQLKVTEVANEFLYYKEKRRDKASGYEPVQRRRGERRAPEVVVVCRTSGRHPASKVGGEFIDACRARAVRVGLVLETLKRPRDRAGGQDGTFELRFLPGRSFETKKGDATEGVTHTLTDVALDDPEEPTGILGRRADGVRVMLSFEDLKMGRRPRDELIEELKQEGK